jgi:hypothetical protein
MAVNANASGFGSVREINPEFYEQVRRRAEENPNDPDAQAMLELAQNITFYRGGNGNPFLSLGEALDQMTPPISFRGALFGAALGATIFYFSPQNGYILGVIASARAVYSIYKKNWTQVVSNSCIALGTFASPILGFARVVIGK